MKRLISILLMFCFTIIGYSQTQRTCASNDVLLQQLAANPALLQQRQQIEDFTQGYILLQNNSANKTTAAIYNIPVVVHVLYNTTAQNISNAQINSQIDILNADFQKLNADISSVPSVWTGITADVQVQFCLAQRDPQGNATDGITRTSTSTATFNYNTDNAKFTSQGGHDAWPRDQYLNIWVVPALNSSVIGYAQFPGGAANTDGVVIKHTCFGNTGTAAAPFNKGRTASHEVGHWLNLYHIWGDDGTSCTGSDLVNDTPNQEDENYGCPSFPTISCSNGPNGDMWMNYMDYTNDACMYMFTNGQKTRMHAVLATGGARASLNTSSGCVPPAAICNVPAGLNATAITTSGATLNWTAVPGATGYNLQWKLSSASTYTTVSGLTTTSYALSGLTAATGYDFRVQTVCSGSATSSYSSISSFTTTTPVCNTPSGLNTTAITSSGATLNWAAVSGATGYNLQWKLTSSGAYTTVSNLNTTSHSLSGLTASSNYHFRVQAICGAGSTSTYSSLSAFTTLAPPVCNTPSSLTATPSVNTASISWGAVSGAASYNLQWKLTTAATWATITGITATSYNLTGLAASTSYNFQVQTVCSGSLTSAYSATGTFITLATAPSCATPAGLAASPVITNAVLSWTAVPSATKYSLQWKLSSAATWTTINNINANTRNLTGLTHSTSYDFKVQAVCGTTGTSAYSTVFTFSTLSDVCDVPVGNTVSATDTTAIISWQPVAGVSGYTLRWRPSGTTAWITITPVSTNSYTLTGLTSNTTYQYQLRAACTNNKQSPFSAVANFTTTSSMINCATPSGLAANPLITSATITWGAVGAATKYNLQWKPSSSATWTAINNLAANSRNLTGLAASTSYDVKVQSVCGTNLTSSFSAVFTFATLSNTCDVPVGNFEIPAETNAVINWSPVPGVATYSLRWRPAGTTAWTTIDNIPSNTYTITGLSANSAYQYSLRASCTNNKNSAFSAIFNFMTTGCTDAYEPNDIKSQSVIVPLQTPFVARINSAADIDYYKVKNTAANPNIRVSLTNLPADYDIKLLKGNVIVASSANAGTMNDMIVYNGGTAQAYFIEVYGYNGAFNNTTCYTLETEISASPFKEAAPANVKELAKEGFILYPNPATNEVGFDYLADAEEDALLLITDQAGRISSRQTIHLTEGINKPKANVSQLPAGMYFVRFITAEGSITRKLVIQR